MKQKKIPMRMCLGCGEMKPKKELIRAVKSQEGGGDIPGPYRQKGRQGRIYM